MSNDGASKKDEQIREAKMVFLQLEKVTSRRKLFSKEHKSYQDAGHDLYAFFKRYIDRYGALRCIVGEYDLYIEKESIYNNSDPFESIPFKLYRDGIRKLSFTTELSEEEFIAFLNIIEDVHGTSGLAEESLQTELWNQDFQSIHYFAIEGLSDKEKLGEDFEYELDAYFEEFTNYINKDSVDQVKLTDLRSFSVDREAFLPKELISDSPMELVDDAQLAKVSTLEEVEVTKIMTHVQQSDERVILKKFVLILFHLLEHSEIVTDQELIIELFQKIASFYIRKGDIEKFLEIIISLRKEIVSNKNITKEHYKKFLEILDFEEGIESIKKEDARYWGSRRKVLYYFLNLFPKEKTNDIYEELFGIEQMQGCEKVFFKIMSERATESIPFLVKLFLDSDKKTSKQAYELLKEINSPAMVELLLPSLDHPSDIVRMSIFMLLDNAADFQSTDVWEKFLKDKNYRIRKLALKKIINLLGKKAFPIILNLLQEDIFQTRSTEEKKDIFNTAAQLSEELLLPYLENIMEGTSLFISEHKINQRLCALDVLSSMHSTRAQQLLKKASRSWNLELRKAAKEAYKKYNEGNNAARKKVS